MNRMTAEKSRRPGGALLLMRLGIRLMACAALLLAGQAALSITQGYWMPCDLAALFSCFGGVPYFADWLLPHAVIDLAMRLPLTAMLAASGVVLALLSAASAGTPLRDPSSDARGARI
jgi:hypothetical protein